MREEYRELIAIQLVALPQSGILKSPGTPEPKRFASKATVWWSPPRSSPEMLTPLADR